ncbi:MAG: LysR family transcriptional regulator [Alphaproteobacteria bacterium]|nr:LysR family transcriptional regulator [Alphaproteobacteria bacterium]
MDLRQLRYFIAIAEYGSFSEAAARLRVAQSALSRQIGALEQELGVALFERHARGVTITPSGTLLVERARRVLDEVAEAQAEVMAQARLPSGEAVIGTTSTTSRMLYGPLAERFTREFPAVHLRFVEGVPYQLLEGLDTGRIDVAVMVDPDPRAGQILEPLVSEQVYLIGPRGAPGMPEAACTIESLRRIPLILLPRPAGSRVRLDHLAAEVGIVLQISHEVANVDVVKDFVARGLGFALLPHSSIMPYVTENRFAAVPLTGVLITRTMVRRAERPPSAAVAVLMDAIRDEMARIIAAGEFGGPAGAGTPA